MPITSSAIKAARQTETRRKRRQPFKTQMKTMIRAVTDLVKDKKLEEARKILPKAYKAIDTAAKKNIIHRKNADRKKSLMARMVASK